MKQILRRSTVGRLLAAVVVAALCIANSLAIPVLAVGPARAADANSAAAQEKIKLEIAYFGHSGELPGRLRPADRHAGCFRGDGVSI
jgi:hypothetical protein